MDFSTPIFVDAVQLMGAIKDNIASIGQLAGKSLSHRHHHGARRAHRLCEQEIHQLALNPTPRPPLASCNWAGPRSFATAFCYSRGPIHARRLRDPARAAVVQPIALAFRRR